MVHSSYAYRLTENAYRQASLVLSSVSFDIRRCAALSNSANDLNDDEMTRTPEIKKSQKQKRVEKCAQQLQTSNLCGQRVTVRRFLENAWEVDLALGEGQDDMDAHLVYVVVIGCWIHGFTLLLLHGLGFSIILLPHF